MLPIVAAAPDAKNDRRDKWIDWLGLSILVLPGFVMAFAGITSPDFSDGRSFVMGLASAADSNTGRKLTVGPRQGLRPNEPRYLDPRCRGRQSGLIIRIIG
jgi:hypothetical protein